MNFKISIIIPVYNAEPYLRRCLASVVSQTLKEIEIICINDGSTDGSLAILEEFAQKDERIILISQENKGVGTARNIGIERASSPYIGFVDSDDFILPDMFERMYIAMLDNNVDLVQCGVDTLFYFPVSEYIQKCFRNSFKIINSGKVYLRENIKWSENTMVWDRLFRKDLIEKHNLHFEYGARRYEDVLFWYEYWTIIQNIFYISDELYIHTIREYSLIGRAFTAPVGGIHPSDWLKVTQLYYQFLLDRQLFDKFKYYFWDIYIYHIMHIYWDAISGIMDKNHISQIKEFLKGKDISYLKEEKYCLLHDFIKSDNDNIVTLYEKKFLGCFKYKGIKHLSNLAIINTLYFMDRPVMDKLTGFLYKIYRALHNPGMMFITMIKLFVKIVLPYGLVQIYQKVKASVRS